MNRRLVQALALAWSVGALEIRAFAAGLPAEGVVVGWGDNRFGEMTPRAKDVVAIAAGGCDSLLLLRDGSVAAYGVYGIDIATTNVVNVPLDLTNAVAVAAGFYHCLALRADGTVTAWDASGLLGVPPSLTNVAAISASWNSDIALRADGTVVCWGAAPVVPSDVANVVAVTIGSTNYDGPSIALALRADGTVAAWDSNGAYAQVPANWTNVVAISGGWGELLALRADGTVAGWNYDPSLAGLSNAVAVAASTGNDGHISLALLADGTLVGWGFNFFGGPDVPPGLSNVVAVASGGELNLALIGGGVPFQTTRPVDRTAIRTGSTYFRVEATGQWPLSYQWQFSGTNLPGATNQVLCLTNLQPGQAGPYSVTVANAAGMVTSEPALLTVVPVFISTSPFDQVGYVGGTATFSVSAQGYGSLSYQWRKDGADIDGATNSVLVLTNLQSAQAAVYSVTVTNAFGAATSAGASLTVLPAIITAQPQDAVTFIGGPATFSIAAQGSVPLTYQWTLNGVMLDGATNATLSLTNLQLIQAGSCSVAVSGPFGTVTSSSAKLSVVRVASWGSLSQSQVPLDLSQPVLSVGGALEALALKANGSVVVWDQRGVDASAPGALTNVVAVSGGWYNVALRADGTISAWPISGGGYTTFYAPPALSNGVAISARYGHGLALTAEGTVVAWGDNYGGASTVPPGLTDVVAIAAGGYHSLALRADGQLVAWGDNEYGQTNVPAGLSNVVGVAAGNWHNLALKADGTVMAFGYDAYRQSEVPPGLSNVVAVACGGFLSMALKADGTVTAWGAFNDGFDTPVVVPPGLKDVVAIAGGEAYCAAIIGDGPPSLNVPVSISSQAARRVSVSVPTQSGRVYRLEYKASLSDANWTPLPLVAGNGGVRELIDPTAAGAQRFYRVRRW